MNNQHLFNLTRAAVFELMNARLKHELFTLAKEQVSEEDKEFEEALKQTSEEHLAARRAYGALMRKVAERLGVEYQTLNGNID